MVNDTINGNSTAAGMSGGIFLAAPGTTTIKNSILASNLPFNCNGVGALEDGGGNLEFPAVTCNFAISAQTGDPKLGPLANNGGPTQTEALLPGSAAIGKGLAATCIAPPINDVDQRGLPRYAVLRGVCDIGAYDTGGGIVPPLTVTGAIPLTTGGATRLGFAASNHGSFPGVALPGFPLGYITFQRGISTFVVRQPVTVSCTSASLGLDHCAGTTGVVQGVTQFISVPGTATLTLTGFISSRQGPAYPLGAKVVVTLAITTSATGKVTVASVTVTVNGTTVATWTAPLPSRTNIQVSNAAPLIV